MEKKKAGRPRIVLNEDQLKHLRHMAACDCSKAEMASELGLNVDTLTDNYSEEIEKGRLSGKKSIRVMQMKVALGGNVAMLIWLGKNKLGQTDKMEQKIDVTHEDEIKRLSEMLLKAAKNPTDV